jgi:hypothetical protein
MRKRIGTKIAAKLQDGACTVQELPQLTAMHAGQAG